jgi:hypothetical protein
MLTPFWPASSMSGICFSIMAALISAGVPSCLGLDAWMWAHLTILDMTISLLAIVVHDFIMAFGLQLRQVIRLMSRIWFSRAARFHLAIAPFGQ